MPYTQDGRWYPPGPEEVERALLNERNNPGFHESLREYMDVVDPERAPGWENPPMFTPNSKGSGPTIRMIDDREKMGIPLASVVDRDEYGNPIWGISPQRGGLGPTIQDNQASYTGNYTPASPPVTTSDYRFFSDSAQATAEQLAITNAANITANRPLTAVHVGTIPHGTSFDADKLSKRPLSPSDTVKPLQGQPHAWFNTSNKQVLEAAARPGRSGILKNTIRVGLPFSPAGRLPNPLHRAGGAFKSLGGSGLGTKVVTTADGANTLLRNTDHSRLSPLMTQPKASFNALSRVLSGPVAQGILAFLHSPDANAPAPNMSTGYIPQGFVRGNMENLVSQLREYESRKDVEAGIDRLNDIHAGNISASNATNIRDYGTVAEDWMDPSLIAPPEEVPLTSVPESLFEVGDESLVTTEYNPEDYTYFDRDPVSRVTTPEIEQMLQEKGALEQATGAGLTGKYLSTAISNPWANMAETISQQQDLRAEDQRVEAERVAQQQAYDAQVAQAAAQSRAASQRAAEQAVVARNQPDRGLVQAQAQVVQNQKAAAEAAHVATFGVASHHPMGELESEQRRAQMDRRRAAEQAAVLNQQAAQAAAAHQAQVAQAQADLAAFYGGVGYQRYGQSAPAALIDMATQIDTFTEMNDAAQAAADRAGIAMDPGYSGGPL